MSRAVIITTGGTIASRHGPGDRGAIAKVGAAEIIDSVPQLAEIADVEVHEFSLVNSWNMTPSRMADLALRIEELATTVSPDGFVVTHGTDTMEESAFVLELLTDVAQPVVLTGAMRSADAPGADGPANLVDAVRAAVDDSLSGQVVVCMSGRLDAARYATKTHANSPDAFRSPGAGPMGMVRAGRVEVGWLPRRLPELSAWDRSRVDEASVVFISMVAGMGDDYLRHVADRGVDGVVLAGSGAGNVHSDATDVLRELISDGTPVVVATRCWEGRPLPSYGGPGGGATLAELGVLRSADIGGPKARLAMILLASGRAGPNAVPAWFKELESQLESDPSDIWSGQ